LEVYNNWKAPYVRGLFLSQIKSQALIISETKILFLLLKIKKLWMGFLSKEFSESYFN
jgi:hypothetical protein